MSVSAKDADRNIHNIRIVGNVRSILPIGNANTTRTVNTGICGSEKMTDYKQRFRAFLEGLEMQQIGQMMEEPPEKLKFIGALITEEFKRLQGIERRFVVRIFRHMWE
jgi:hypothetical protein